MTPTIAVTGATGFIGRHLINFLKNLDRYRVVAVGRDENKLQKLGIEYVVHDLNLEYDNCYELLKFPDILIHLAWEGLPQYNELFHFEHNLMTNYKFLKNIIQGGLKNLAVAGTCYEYGMQSGCLSESVPALPTTSYAIAKDALRHFIEILQKQYLFRFCWARFFFLYGDGQNQKSFIPQLEKAIADNAEFFAMSGGEQLRDYLPVEEAAKLLTLISLQENLDGIFNICSGKPVSIRRMAESIVSLKKSNISLKLGVFPYPDYEPMAYWGDRTRLDKAIKEFTKE